MPEELSIPTVNFALLLLAVFMMGIAAGIAQRF